MSLVVSQTQLKGAAKELFTRWDEAVARWDDPMRHAFEKDFLAPLDPKIRSTLAAMDRMGEMLARARRECE
jgi:hypothetical protein